MNDRRLSSNCRLFSLPTSSNWRAWVRLVCFAATAMTPLGAVSADKGGADTSQASAAAKAPADATTNPIAEAPPVAKSGEPTAESVAAQIKQLEAAEAELPDRAKLLEIYHQALDDLKQAAAQKAHADELEAKRAAAPNQLKLRKAAASAAPAVAANLPADAALANWEQLLDTAEQELETAQKTLAAKEDEERHRATRRLEIPQEIATARMKLDMLDPSATDATAAADDSPAVAAARQIALAASRHVLETEIALLEKEQQTYDDTASELLSLEHDAAAQTVEDTQKRVAAWRESVNKRREAEAERQAQEAHWAAANAEPAVRSLAEENSTLADRHSELTKRREELSAETDAVTTRLNQILDDFKHIEDKVGAHGSKEAVGYLLRKQRSELAAIDADRRAIGQRQEEIAKVQMELIDLQETSTRLRNLDNRVKEFIAALPPGSVVKPDDVRTLLKSKRKYIDALTGDESAYFSDLYELDTTQEKLVSEAEDELKFIDENVLWTRSAQPLSPGDAKKAVEAAAWLVRPANWLVAAQALVKSLRADVGFSVFIGVVLAGWFVIQTWLRRAIGKWSSASTPSDVVVADDTLRRACQTSIATLLIAALWPSTLWILGSFIAGGSTLAGDFPQAAGKALQIGAAVLLPLLFVRQICRRQGLGESHFGWSADALLTIRRQLNGLIVVGTPLAIVVAALEVQATDAWKDSLGRLLFIAGQLLVASLAFTAFRPAGKSLIGGVPLALPVLPDSENHTGIASGTRRLSLRYGSWTQRLSQIAYLVLPILPLTLVYLAAAGYYDTALRLTCRFEATAWLALSVIVFHALAARWIDRFLQRVSLTLSASLDEDSSLDNPAEPSPLGRGQGEGDVISVRAPHPDALPVGVGVAAVPVSATAQRSQLADAELAKIDRQAHRLLRSGVGLSLAIGLVFIWSAMFPALKALNDIGLWDVAGVDGNTVKVTLANLLESVAVAAMTIVAAANLPSLLQMLVLKRLPLDNGVRFALATVVRYVIAIIGLTWAGAAVGIGWPKMQWLVAAISFGLGFGLQEIFANFVSGLIVLWERPIRIGDTVTVGDVTGVVSRIQMRATTILDADRKELIVPNKEFITARLVNWTLSDSVTRLVVPVGLTYGSDTRQAQRLLLRVASEIPTVLRTPPAKAVFMGFGEKTLNFELRVFVGDVDALMPTRHHLNMAIDKAFRAAGIDIAIPQRDSQARAIAASLPPQPREKAA